MSWNKFKNPNPEYRLALRLTASIVWVLILVMALVTTFGFIRQMNQQERFFLDRIEMIRNSPRFHDIFESGTLDDIRQEYLSRRKAPPFFRNLIIYSGGKVLSTGFLADTELPVLPTNKLNKTYKVKIGESVVLFYGVRIADKVVIVYDSLDMIQDLQLVIFFWSLILILIFWVILFFISLKIAKNTIEPIRKSEELARSYNHHIAHELKTPLAIIKSDLELASRDMAGTKEYIASAQEEVVAMRKTIDNLLFLAQKEAKKSLEEVPLLPLVREVEHEIQKLYDDKKITFDFRITEWASLLADEWLLKVLFKNLFENVGKYARPVTDAVVTLTSGVIMITNSSDRELSSAELTAIFDPFSGTPWSGHGLGLSIVKRICDIHSWKISATSTATEFSLRILTGK